MESPYIIESPPKSTGPELFNMSWLRERLENLTLYKPEDVQATLLEFTALTISQSISHNTIKVNEVFLCGGGAYNVNLVDRIKKLMAPTMVSSTSMLGIAPEWVEAAAFAWLAKQTIEGLPGNIPSVTGAKKASVLGAIYSK